MLRRLRQLADSLNDTVGYVVLFSSTLFLPLYSYKIQSALQGNVGPIIQVLLTFWPYCCYFLLFARGHAIIAVRYSNENLFLSSYP